jgi:hypothetical protein
MKAEQFHHRAGSLHMLSLNGYRRNMFLMRHRLFLRCWAPVDPPVSAVVTDPGFTVLLITVVL